jgi:hypothetical protein
VNQIQMKYAMVWWNDNEEAEDHPGLPRIAVMHRSHVERGYGHLSNSAGGCNGGWESSGPGRQAVCLLAIYAWATGRDGVPADEAHKQFLKIKEYRDWLEGQTGPFADAYFH